MQTLDFSYVKIPVSLIKERLLKVCVEHKKSGLPFDKYLPNVEYVAKRNWYKTVMYRMAEHQFEILGLKEDFNEYFGHTIEEDWNRVFLEAAAYSWLCTEGDKDRLDLLYPKDKTLPDDLAYGLVLQYYQPVMRMTCFLSGFTYDEERDYIPADVLNEAGISAVEDTYEQLKHLRFLNLTKDDVFDMVMKFKW
jgi:hypothetical protein